MRKMLLAATSMLAGAAIAATALQAQQPAPAPAAPPITQGASNIKRTVLQKLEIPGSNLETIVALLEVKANFKAGRHTHPGHVVGYVMEGEFFMYIDGQPEKMLKVGDSLIVPSGTIHDEGTKDKPAKIIAIYNVEKGKPLATPVK